MSTRWLYCALGMVLLSFAVYGSLLPFRYAPLRLGEAIEGFQRILRGPLTIPSRTDFLANILLFIPISYCFLATLAVDRNGSIRTVVFALFAFFGCAASSLLLEFSQIWMSGRVPALNDIVAQSIGTMIGIALWVYAGQAVTNMLRADFETRNPSTLVQRLLWVYLIGLLFFSFLPFDLSIRPGDLVDKYHAGRIVLVPFSEVEANIATIVNVIVGAGLFVPVGAWAVTRTSAQPSQGWRVGLASVIGVATVVFIELAQLFVYSRFTSATDIVVGSLGIIIGVFTASHWAPSARAATTRSLRPVWMWLGMATVYALVLVLIFCVPFDGILLDRAQIRARLDRFLTVPLAVYQHGSPINALEQVFRKVLAFAPLGVFFTMAITRYPLHRRVRRLLLLVMLLIAAGIATAIELLQVFLPPHVPSSDDVILYTVGAAAGMAVTSYLLSLKKR